MMLDYIVAILLWLSLIIYAVFGGADFGAGIWEFFTFGPHGRAQRNLITTTLKPVWEANNVWLTYLVVGLFTAFPTASYVLAHALFVPLSLALIGVVFRGASFGFRSHFRRAIPLRIFWARFFSAASTITPFLLGTVAGAVASNMLRLQKGKPPTLVWEPWLNPFSLVIGFMALGVCAAVSATYLIINAEMIENQELIEDFRKRALIAGAVTAALGVVGFFLMPSFAPALWSGLFSRTNAIWAVGVTILIGVGAAAALVTRRYRTARTLVDMDVAAFLGTWGLAQVPYIIPPDLTITNAASPPTTLFAFLVSAILGMLILIPSLWFLFYVFESKSPLPPVHGQEVEGI
jgi:cytochrome d ubiquinol oxidase subunit II